MQLFVTISLILFSVHTSFCQIFWRTTYEFPGREKTGITISPNGCLFVSLTNGVIKSCDEGNNFTSVLNSSAVFTIHSNTSGELFVGGLGKIFRSFNNGHNWDSVNINTIFPIKKIIDNSQGHLFAITGELTENGYEGDGIFFSTNNGLSWLPRNNGLGIYTCIEQITIDKNDRLYISAADEYVSGNGGLFISENSGDFWEHINIEVNGNGTIDNHIKIANCSGLSVSLSDSVYFSFTGVAENNLVKLNVVKEIMDVRNNMYWKHYTIVSSPTWWIDRPLHNIHFAGNGDKYSSVSGTINFGGTFYCRNQQYNWEKINYGLGTDIFGKHGVQHFAEMPNGKIFMIQMFDERIYYTETSIVTSVMEPVINHNLVIYPNPVNSGQTIIVNGLEQTNFEIMVYDVIGKLVSKTNDFIINAPGISGVYFISIRYGRKLYTCKLIVK